MDDNAPVKRVFRPDTSLIRQWSKAVEKEAPLAAPYVAAFGREDAQLRYVAAHHGGDIDSPTFRTVKQLFDEFRPQVVIVEGVPNEGKISPAWYVDFAREKAKTGFRQGGGETAYAAFLAYQSGIDFVPAEPMDSEKAAGLKAKGYSDMDYIGWSTAQVLTGSSRLTAENVSTLLPRIMEQSAKAAGLDPAPYTFEAFKNWYAEKTGNAFDFNESRKLNLSPDKDGTFLQQLTQAVDDVREPHIVKTVAAQMEKFDRVLVVYGSSHLAKQEKVYRRMLGKPHYQKPF